jgi:5'-nucleotidase
MPEVSAHDRFADSARTRRGRRLAFILLAAVLVSGLVWRTPGLADPNLIAVQLLAINDFHGNLEPPAGGNGRIGSTAAGGVEYLATHLSKLKATMPNTLIVSAGDNIGASPLLSKFFHHEPTIEALNAAGLDVSSVGNHEFDQGWIELFRMQRGGCHPVDGCQDHTPFDGARFQYLAANVMLDPSHVDQSTLRQIGWPSGATTPAPLMPPYTIREIGGARIAFIGLTLEGTRQTVIPTAIRSLTFRSEAATANRLVPEIERLGVRSIVVLIHQGGAQDGSDDDNGCQQFSGPIVDIANQMSSEISVVVSGHTHRAYNCTIGGKLVTSASSFGRMITRIHLEIDRTTDRIVSKTAKNVIVTRDVVRDSAETAILDHYRPFYTDLAHRVVGTIARTVSREPNSAGEFALGDVIADAQLEAARRLLGGDISVAFMNSGSVRADLTEKSRDGTPGRVTYEDAFAVQPFENRLIVKTMTGRMIQRLLEQQFNGAVGGDAVLQVSDGFRYVYDLRKPPQERVDPATIRIHGAVLQPFGSYRVVMNEFLAAGGSGFAVFTEGTDALTAGTDVDALTAFLGVHSPVEPGPRDRIGRAGPP